MPGLQIGMLCADVLKIVNYDLTSFFKNERGVRPIQVALLGSNIQLFGNAVFHDDGCLFAVRFSPSDEVFADSALDLGDFSHADPVILSTMSITIQRAMLEESQSAALELAEERQRVENLLDRTSRVAGYLAHDFNNILSIIELNAVRLTRNFDKDSAKIENVANIIKETASRGSEITKSLMTLSHQQTDTVQPIVVDDLIRENNSILHSAVGTGIALTLDLQAEQRRSVVSYNGLLNVLINLLINAREAMPHGGHISLSTKVRHDVVPDTLQVTQRRDCISICISDNGKGMTEALLSRAFEPMFSSKPNGTGLGLASARNFADDVGGDVTIESSLGKGTTVTLHLPAFVESTSEMPARSRTAVSHEQNRTRKQKILVVEDEPYALAALVEILEAEDHDVTPCASSKEALRALERGNFDVLLTDIVMPDENGAKIARLACAAQPSIKVILMSGYVPDTAELQPGWMFLKKPLDRTKLFQILLA
ncbi:ATP-binding protein [Sphingorhabdus sp.]|uniref:ATP-binding protein n=1 Tax=Sphingorhabdus sp. TaxID=1902408 RepID=UPI00391DC84C